MYTCRHYQHAGGQSGCNHGLVTVGGGNLHGRAFHRHAGAVKHPHVAGLALLKQRTGGQLYRLHTGHAGRRLHHHGRPYGWRLRGINRHFDRKGACNRVGAGAYLAYTTHSLACGLAGIGPAFNRHLGAYRPLAHTVLGHVKHNIARAVLCNTHHRCTGADHLALLCLYRRNNACYISHQRGVTRLVTLRFKLHLGLL